MPYWSGNGRISVGIIGKKIKASKGIVLCY
jgi:hypothetical protein